MNLSNISTYDETNMEDFSEVCNFYKDDKPVLFGQFINNNINQDLKNGVYFMTYGGGPEGGYVLTPNGNIFEVERNWGKPFSVRKTIYNKMEIMIDDNDRYFIKPTY